MIDLQMARALFVYDPNTGSLSWRISTNAFTAGAEAGTVAHQEGYASYRNVVVFGDRYKAHRIAWLLQTGAWPERYIDHIDGNGLNNEWRNLRLATPSQNMMNQKTRTDNTSGCKGVSFDKHRNVWYAYLNVGGNRVFLGRHQTKDDAVVARLAGEQNYHGEHARRQKT